MRREEWESLINYYKILIREILEKYLILILLYY